LRHQRVHTAEAGRRDVDDHLTGNGDDRFTVLDLQAAQRTELIADNSAHGRGRYPDRAEAAESTRLACETVRRSKVTLVLAFVAALSATVPVSNAGATRAQAVNGPAPLVAVRVGRHPGFDRIVFEFAGPTLPTVTTTSVSPPLALAPSDLPVQVVGSAFVQITMNGASGTDLTGTNTYVGPDRLTAGGANLIELVRTQDFEGVLTWVAGLRTNGQVTVSQVQDPARIVVDIQAATEPAAPVAGTPRFTG
jgi:hypothetical protein